MQKNFFSGSTYVDRTVDIGPVDTKSIHVERPGAVAREQGLKVGVLQEHHAGLPQLVRNRVVRIGRLPRGSEVVHDDKIMS